MKKLLLLCLFLVSVTFLNAVGRTITGSTGYVTMPTAEGLRFQEYSLGLNAFSGTKYVRQHWKYYMSLGTSEGSELSISGRSEREGLFANLKWFGTLGQYEDPLLVGIGFENLSSLGTNGDYPDMFMVVTKKFLGGNSFSIGSTGRYIDRQVFASMIAGMEIFTTETFSWLGDIAAYEDNRYNLNVGLRIYSNPNTFFSIQVVNAVRNNDDPDAHPTVATIGLTMNSFM